MTPLLQAALVAAVQVPRRAECLAAIRAALEARAKVNEADDDGYTPLHWAAHNTDAAALTAAVEVLVAAGADVRAGDCYTREPLHWACMNENAQAAAAGVQALLVAGSDALKKNMEGWTALSFALHYNHSLAAEALLEAMPADAVLEELSISGKPLARQLLPAFVASHLPLADAQWALILIAPGLGLARALPAALACSVDQARQLVRRLPLPAALRLRTAALCLARVQRRMPLWPQQHLPLAIVERILCSAVDDA